MTEHIAIAGGHHEDIGPYAPAYNGVEYQLKKQQTLEENAELWQIALNWFDEYLEMRKGERDAYTLKPIEVYRKCKDLLRQKEGTEAATLLRELLLEVSTPMNEAETPYFVDSYTGEIVSEDQDDEESMYVSGETVAKRVPEKKWSQRIEEAYAHNPELIPAALNASRQHVGTVGIEEEVQFYETERDRVPDFFEPKLVGFTAKRFADKARRDIGKLNNCERVYVEYEVGFTRRNEQGTLIAKGTKRKFKHIDELHKYHLYLDHQLRWIGVSVDQAERALAIHLISDVRNPKPGEFSLVEMYRGEIDEWIDNYDDNRHERELIRNNEMTDGELATAIKSLYPPTREPEKTQAFIEGYIASIINGGKSKDAINMAWDRYRHSISPDAQRAFLATSGSMSEKWSAFYRVARAQKALTDTIVSVNPRGLVLRPTVGRDMLTNWNALKSRLDTLEHDKEDLMRLHSLLEEKQWGEPFRGALMAHINSI